MPAVVLDAKNLTVRFGQTLVVRNVSLTLNASEVLGLVGASGSGKTTLAKALLGLTPLAGGSVKIEGLVQPVFQDPSSALDPHWCVSQSLEEPLRLHGVPNRSKRVAALLESVQLDVSVGSRRPHELSAGQRQRVNIARALALEPRGLVLDEPVSALDVSVQAQVLNLLTRLKAERGLALLFISHDLDVVSFMADRTVTMQNGELVSCFG